MNDRHPICGAVVTYNPDLGIRSRIPKILNNVEHIVVVDNHSEPETVECLRELSKSLHFDIILNDHNVGIAGALNQCVKWASARDYKWILLFDQDSIPLEDYSKNLLSIYDLCPDRERIAVIGSAFFDVASGIPVYPRLLERNGFWSDTFSVITSGSLLSIPIYQRLGPFVNAFFMDQVDEEYCLRARARGFKILICLLPRLYHSIGTPTRHRFLWQDIATSNYSPVRRYYIVRNRTSLLLRYGLKEPGWTLLAMWDSFRSAFGVLLYEKKRTTKIKMMLRGLCDGLWFKW